MRLDIEFIQENNYVRFCKNVYETESKMTYVFMVFTDFLCITLFKNNY